MLLTLARDLEPGDFRQTLTKIGLYKRNDPDPLSADDITACAPASIEAAVDDVLLVVGDGQAAQIGPVMRRINMYPERALSERCIHNIDDPPRDGGRICIRRLKRAETIKRLGRHVSISARQVSVGYRLVIRRSGMSEMIGPGSKRTGHHDRRFDPPAGEFGGVRHSE